MINKILYRYKQDKYTVDSLILPENQVDYLERYRLIADEGKVLTKDDENFYVVIDIDKADFSLWKEIDIPETLNL